MKPNHDTDLKDLRTGLKMEEKIDLALRMAANPRLPVGLANRVQQRIATAAQENLPRRTWLLSVPATCAALAVVLLAVGLPMHFRRKEAVRPLETAHVSPAMSAQQRQDSRNPASAPRQISARRVKKFRVAANHRRSRHAANLFSYPLTRQERLLVEFARNAKPADLQILNPEYQAKVEATENAEFAAYLKSGNSPADDASETTQTKPTTQE